MAEETLEQIFKKASSDHKYLKKLLDRGREQGFSNFFNRKVIWPFLLEIKQTSMEDSSFEWKQKMSKNSPDYEQLQKDAERSLSSMKTFDNITKFHLRKKQGEVLTVLDNFFAKNTHLKYIQGFHDVASIFLILFGSNMGYYMMERAGKVYFHDFLKYDVGEIGVIFSSLVLDLILSKDRDFEQIFQCYRERKLLMFIIPWVLTFFAHVFSSVKIICRIWDYILSTGPHAVIYLTAGIILSTKEELVETCSEFDEASLHTFYQQKEKNQSIDIEQSIQIAIQLQKSINISQLNDFKQLHENSTFRLQNFERHITIHKICREYRKAEEQKAKNNTKLLIASGLMLGAIAAVFLMKSGRLKFLSSDL